jgi:hypothetical protein
MQAYRFSKTLLRAILAVCHSRLPCIKVRSLHCRSPAAFSEGLLTGCVVFWVKCTAMALLSEANRSIQALTLHCKLLARAVYLP